MDPGYTIDIDQAQQLVRLTLFGFWNEATLLRYKEDVRRLNAAAAKLPPARHTRVLIDMRDHVLLSKEHAESLQAAVATPRPGTRTAILLKEVGMLQLQARRVANSLQPRFFISESEAMSWLMA